MKRGLVASLIACALVGACGSDAPAQRQAVDEGRLNDGSQLRCVAENKVGWHYDAQQNPTYKGKLDRIGWKQSEFRALYRVTDKDVSGSNPAMTAMVLFGHTVPLHEQVHFPPPVEAPSLTFLRTEPGVFMLFQLDPWDDQTAAFTWVERRQEEAFMANGRCTMIE